MRMSHRAWAPAVLVALVGFMGGCGGESTNGAAGAKAGAKSGAKAVAITAVDRKEANEMYQTRCVACHGTFGRGDGPGSSGLNPKPRDYTDAAWQQTVTDEEIEKAIVYGGAAIGKSPQMVANPDLQAKPGVVAALREKVRKFGK